MVKDWTPLRWTLVAAVAISAGVLLVMTMTSQLERSEPESQDAQPVLVARHYIPPYSVIKEDDVSLRNYPREWLPLAALHQTTELALKDGHPAFLCAVALPAGQPLTRTVLLETNRNHGMASALPTGTVAVSFSVDKVRGVGGWARPGDRASIYATAHEIDAKFHPAQQTRMLFPTVEILAINDARLGETDDAAGTGSTDKETASSTGDDSIVVTVRMNPAEAAALVQAREQGHLSITLLALGDEGTADATANVSERGSHVQ